MIPITLKATGAVVLTDELKAYVEEKLKKLEKVVDQNDTTMRADIELATTSGARTGEQFRAEINFCTEGKCLRAEATRDNLHVAYDEAVEEVRREIRKVRTKHRDLLRRGAARVKDLYRYWTGN